MAEEVIGPTAGVMRRAWVAETRVVGDRRVMAAVRVLPQWDKPLL